MTIFEATNNVTNFAGVKILCKVNIKRGIFQSLFPLLFVISLIPLTLVVRKVKAGYDLGQSRGVINHLLYIDDLKVYKKNENKTSIFSTLT